jgi:hypothetical protein
VTAQQLTPGDRARLGEETTLFEKGELDRDRFLAEVARAMLGRGPVVHRG